MNCFTTLDNKVALLHVSVGSKISTELVWALSETEEHSDFNCEHRPAHLNQMSEMTS
jgi:hypothetical protein